MWKTTDRAPPVAYSAEEASAMDAWLMSERAFTLEGLMGHAGAALADAAAELAREHGLARLVFLVGPGHNGGDALVARERLAAHWPTELWRPLEGDPPPDLDARTLVVDGLFGVGLARPVDGPARAAVEHLNASPARVLSVDVPSGLSATTGEVVGCTADDPAGGVAVRADHTLTFVGPKQGFFVGAGPRHVGTWRAASIGFPVHEADAWVQARRAGRRP